MDDDVSIHALRPCQRIFHKLDRADQHIENICRKRLLDLSSKKMKKFSQGPLILHACFRLLFLFQIYNANLKISLMKSDNMALAGGVGFHHFNWNLEGEEDFSPTAITPYVAVTFGMGPKTNLHVGGEYYLFTEDFNIDDVEVESSVSGSRVYAGLEYSMSVKTKFLFEGGYDIDFEGLTFGGAVLFGWERFRLKLGVSYYNPKAVDNGFALPVIGLWWRFKG